METVSSQKSGKEDKIFEVIDRVLRQLFGDEAAHLIYRYLERNYSLRRGEIAEKIDVFARGLEEFLRSGAYVVERKILEDIYSSYGVLHRLELDRMREEWDFGCQVKWLMQKA